MTLRPLALALLALACTPTPSKTDPRDTERRDSADSVDSVDSERDSVDTGPEPEDPWENPDYWTETNELSALLDLSRAPSGLHWELYMMSSADGLAWDAPGTLLGHSFSSLDLLIHNDVLILLGVPFVIPEIDWGCENPVRGQVLALSTPDLVNWGGHYWAVEGEESNALFDPNLHRLADGSLRLLYFPVPEKFMGEPSSMPGSHDFRVGTRQGGSFLASKDPIYAAEGGADPVVCLHQERYHFFSTAMGDMSHATSENGLDFTPDSGFRWPGFTVPFCYERNEQLEIVAHSPSQGRPAERLTLQSDGTFATPTPIFEDESAFRGHPTSLVVGYFLGSWRLFYAVWTDLPIPT